MELEAGDDYIRRIAEWIRNHEQNLAEGGFVPRLRRRAKRPESTSFVLNPLSWLSSDNTNRYVPPPPTTKPMVLSLDTHHLFYLLMRMEALGLDVGSLDVKVNNPSRPMNYINLFPDDKSDTLSMASFRSSLSAVSRLSLGSGWWSRADQPTVDTQLKYIYSSFTKLPALILKAPGPQVISELANDAPNENALPLDLLKNLNTLECHDIDPRTLLGWDRLSDSLKSLTIKRSGLADVSEIFITAVQQDRDRRRNDIRRQRASSYLGTSLPNSVAEDDGEDTPTNENPPSTAESPTAESGELPAYKWGFLKQLCLAGNELTFFPTAPLTYLTSVTHLDLSSNLLVSVPPGLDKLYNLVSLNLSDNMIDSVLGIYTMLGQILYLNLSRNRLDSLCGLERLMALEKVDLRENQIEESAEVGRLATLPNVKEVWVEDNPFCEVEENYRVKCFEYFWKEGKDIVLDSTAPGFYEKRYMTSPPPEQMTSSRPASVATSPPVVAVGNIGAFANGRRPSSVSPGLSPSGSTTPSSTTSPHLAPTHPVAHGRRKKNKRIVDLDGKGGVEGDKGEGRKHGHRRTRSEAVGNGRKEGVPENGGKESTPENGEQSGDSQSNKQTSRPTSPQNPLSPPSAFVSSGGGTLRAPARSRHSRYQTSYSPVTNFHFVPPDSSSIPPPVSAPSPPTASEASKTQTIGRRSSAAKSAMRKARVSASVFDPPPEEQQDAAHKEAEAFRARIEALKSDAGESWLKIFSQTELQSPRA